MKIRLSYSSLGYLFSCKRKYYYRYIEHISENRFNFNFFVGNVTHACVATLYKYKQYSIKQILKEFNNEFDKVKKEHFLGSTEIQKILDYKHIILAMIEGYYIKFKKDIGMSESLSIEYKFEYEIINDIIISGRIDNLIVVDDSIRVHEIKTPAVLTTDYILSIRNDFQTTLYYYIYNKICSNNDMPEVNGIIYDIIKKPGIRQKEKETLNSYKTRIKNYYAMGSSAYYREEIEKPLRSEAELFNSLAQTIDFLVRAEDNITKYYTNDMHCNVYRRCEYYSKCYGISCTNNLFKGA